MHHATMRTTITLDEDVHEYASVYAQAQGITLSRAIGELVRRAQVVERPVPTVLRLRNGFPVFSPAGTSISAELVKEIEEEEFVRPVSA